MGRGRQKAKATRQAREMKYFSPQTDYSALQRELRAKQSSSHTADRDDRHGDDDDYSVYAERYSDSE